MPPESRIFVYAEATPVDDDVAAPGLYRAAVPILKSISDHIAMIGLYPQSPRLSIEVAHPQLRARCRSLPKAFSWLRQVRGRLGLPDDLENGIVARIVGKWVKEARASHLLCLEGSDPQALARAKAVAAWAGIPFSVYLVDDFESTMRLNGATEAAIAATKARMADSLAHASHVFAITDELGNLLHTQFGVVATTLRLACEPSPAPDPPRKEQIFFLGSINFLYISALRTLLNIVARLRNETGRDITVRFTYGGRTALDPLPGFVHAAPIESAKMLAQEIAASLFAFLPYAFEPELRTMVETSFPSKSMECLAYARSIIVYAPPYGNSARFFDRAGLTAVVHNPDALELEIRHQLAEPVDHGNHYRAYLAEKHGLKAARQTLLSALFAPPS